MNPYVRLPKHGWGALLLVAGLGLLTANPWLTLGSVVLLPILVGLLWRRGEVPILLFALSFQWLQVTARIFHADIVQVPVAALSLSRSAGTALWLSLIGLSVLGIGMRLGTGYVAKRPTGDSRAAAWAFSVDRVFVGYVIATILASVLTSVAWAVPRITQALLAVTELKWVLFFLLACVVLVKRERSWYLVLAISYEMFIGLGYFSTFKIPLFFTGLAMVAVLTHLTWRSVVRIAVFALGLLLIGTAWMNVRSDYRTYVNRGTSQQVVVPSTVQRWNYLFRLVKDLRPEALVRGLVPLAERISYVDYFALAVDRVPTVRPHEHGRLWRQAIRHVLMPRTLVPGKPVLPSDSELTMRYTGLPLSSGLQGTSISLGYMAESYVDFGPLGMFVPIFLLGLLWGAMYAFFVSGTVNPLIANAFAAVVLVHASLFEIAAVKLLGGVLMKFIILAFVFQIGVKALERWSTASLSGCAGQVSATEARYKWIRR